MTDQNLPSPLPRAGQMLIYRDGSLNLQVRLDGQTVWLTQAAMAKLFQTTPQNITLHIKSIYEEREPDETATCKEYLQVRQEGASATASTEAAPPPRCPRTPEEGYTEGPADEG